METGIKPKKISWTYDEIGIFRQKGPAESKDENESKNERRTQVHGITKGKSFIRKIGYLQRTVIHTGIRLLKNNSR